MSPVNVILLMDDLEEWSGTEVHLRRLLSAVLGRDGIATQFAHSTNTRVHSLGIHSVLSLEGLKGAARIADLLRAERAQLLVTYHTASDLLGPIAGRLAGVPVISCRRDEGFTKKPIHVTLQRALNPLLRGMICVSYKVRRAVQRSEGYSTAMGQVIWNGEDLERFSPGPSGLRRELGISAETLVICSVSLLSPIKDHTTQIQGMKGVFEQNPDSLLLVVGDGPERASLEAAAGPLGAQVRFLGHRDDIPDLLRGCDVLLQTSLSEGFSNTILQAMAAALPVVVTSVGGNVELVSTKCGFLVDRRSPDQVTRRTNQLLASASLRRKMGTAGRARVESYCSLEDMVERYTDAFERAAAGDFPGPSYP